MTVPSSVLAPKVTPLPLSQVRRQLSEDFCCWCAIGGQHTQPHFRNSNTWTNMCAQPRPNMIWTIFQSTLFKYLIHFESKMWRQRSITSNMTYWRWRSLRAFNGELDTTVTKLTYLRCQEVISPHGIIQYTLRQQFLSQEGSATARSARFSMAVGMDIRLQSRSTVKLQRAFNWVDGDHLFHRFTNLLVGGL